MKNEDSRLTLEKKIKNEHKRLILEKNIKNEDSRLTLEKKVIPQARVASGLSRNIPITKPAL